MYGSSNSTLSVEQILDPNNFSPPIEEPKAPFCEQVMRIFNSLSKMTVESKATELEEVLKASAAASAVPKETYAWLAFYITQKRAAKELNLQVFSPSVFCTLQILSNLL